jgi:hypothetical protein
MKKKLFYIALPLIALVIFKMWFSATHGFKIKKISPPVSWSACWNNGFSHLPGAQQDEIKKILKQRFTYLARGQQAYAFASDDGQYVIKFIRIPKYKAPFWTLLPCLPQDLQRYGAKAASVKEHFWQSCQKSFALAEKDLKEESALVYVHLHPTSDLKTSVVVVDPLGFKHTLDLDCYSFALQKRAEMIGPCLTRLQKEGRSEEIDKLLTSFVRGVKYRAQKLIRNKNRNCMKNLGVIEGKVVEFDVGELRENPLLKDPGPFSEELEKSSRQLKKWLSEHMPEKVGSLDSELKQAAQA